VNRDRAEHVKQRLSELDRALGQLAEEPEQGRSDQPSWGPIGSLARQLPPDEYHRLLALHREQLGPEFDPEPTPPEPEPEPSPEAARPKTPPPVWDRE
jgi:hypothetical protein